VSAENTTPGNAIGVTAVVDLTAGFPENGPFLKKTYDNVQLAPLTAPNVSQLAAAVDFVRAAASRSVLPAKARNLGPQVLLEQDWVSRVREFDAGLRSARVVAR
jgi:hypothetical protein